ncbi:hypothetical protein SCHPADRAFT_318869 [Schizopora paradoxa]|uniref:Uncharacterized protein n=1 Tax=Schizopora paradoxa TaxID=27342 RepID=A0A0H2RQS1_9AGAM|nr:hypothetical protein SCHPADRAFT_318869 [Schizopora paradoxa]
MDDSDSNSSNLCLDSQPTNDDTGSNQRDITLLSAPWIEDLHRDQSTISYSYFSTYSTNYTMSNLVGPGRLLGNLYSKAGSSLERRLGKLAYRAGIGGHAKAEAYMLHGSLYLLIESDDPMKWEEACEMLLICAR